MRLGWFLYFETFHDQQMQVFIQVHFIWLFYLFPIFFKYPDHWAVPYPLILS